MVIGLWWMAHQDGVHLRIRSQNWLKYKLAVKTASQRSDHYDSWIWPRSVNKSITVRQIDKLIDWWWRKFGWTKWSIRDKEESGIHKQVLFLKKICCIEKEKQLWIKTLCFQRDPPASAPSVTDCLRSGQRHHCAKGAKTVRYSSFAWRNLTQPRNQFSNYPDILLTSLTNLRPKCVEGMYTIKH